MKKMLLLVLALSTVMLSGCTSGLYPEVDEKLTSLPTQPHAREVEVFLAGEWPQEEYIKVAALETRGGENTPYIKLIKSLQAKARAYGADAVVVQDKKFISDVHTEIITERVATTGWSALTGIAIKYKKNLETGLMPKIQEVEMYDPITDAYHPLLALQFSPGGEIIAKDEKHINAAVMYNNYIQPYTLRHLKAPGAGWTHRQQEGVVVERELHRGSLLQKRMEFDYDVARRLKQIRIHNVGGASEEINYKYDAAGHLIQRIILRDSKPYLLEEYTYDESGQAREVQIYNINLPEKLPILRSTYAYYALDEL